MSASRGGGVLLLGVMKSQATPQNKAVLLDVKNDLLVGLNSVTIKDNTNDTETAGFGCGREVLGMMTKPAIFCLCS
jgi:hypothetical protein